MSDIDTIFAVWPSARAMADEIKVADVTVRAWRNRSGTIPPRYWERIQQAALARGQALPLEAFAPPGVAALPTDTSFTSDEPVSSRSAE